MSAPRRRAQWAKFQAASPAPTGPAPLSFTCPNFVAGRPITYALGRDGFRYQVGNDEAVQTDAKTYPQAAAIARRKYRVPSIGCQQTGGVA